MSKPHLLTCTDACKVEVTKVVGLEATGIRIKAKTAKNKSVLLPK